MAIAKIKHIDMFFTKRQKGKILSLVQKLGFIQLLEIKEIQPAKQQGLTQDFEKLEDAVNYLENLSPKKGLLSSKPYFKEGELDNISKEFDPKHIIEHLTRIRERISSIHIELDRLNNTKNNLRPWQGLNLPLRDIVATKYVEIILGVINPRRIVNLEEDIKKNRLNLYFEIVNQKDNLAYILIIYLKKEKEGIHSLLKRYNFNHVILPKLKGAPLEIILETEANIAKLNEEKKELWNAINSLLPEKIKLMVLADKLNNERILKNTASGLFETNYVSLIRGWIKKNDLALLQNALSDISEVEIILRDPKPGEEVPVDLENKRLIRPFEFITKIYGMPKYNELDPTPFLAPFFFLYFGFCVSDVGYGILLTALCWFILKSFKMGQQGIKFFRLFLYCGISTMIIGALTGSWFGNLFDLLAQSHKVFLPLKRFKDSLVIIEPLKQPTRLLGVALAFGIIQVWFGNIAAAIGNIKNKRYLNVLLDQISMLTLLFGLTGLGFIFLKLLDKTHINLFKYAVLLAAMMLILTQGRTEKTIGSKLFFGIYNLYIALSGYLSDILSYSRLWALGLVTSVMATTINLISVQFSQILPSVIPFINRIVFLKVIIGSLVLIIIFIFGHMLSFLMNLLGAFVHPLRLQFVEFFSKFFKSGGSAFRPFKIETKYINISKATRQ